MEEKEFMDVLKQNKDDELKKFILLFGKKPKPFSPIYFFESKDSQKGETNNEWREAKHGAVNGWNQRVYKEAEEFF